MPNCAYVCVSVHVHCTSVGTVYVYACVSACACTRGYMGMIKS